MYVYLVCLVRCSQVQQQPRRHNISRAVALSVTTERVHTRGGDTVDTITAGTEAALMSGELSSVHCQTHTQSMLV